MISKETKIWLEKCGQAVGVGGEEMEEIILEAIRGELGITEGNVVGWLRRGAMIEERLQKMWEENRETRELVEETVRAARTYLKGFQGEKPEGESK